MVNVEYQQAQLAMPPSERRALAADDLWPLVGYLVVKVRGRAPVVSPSACRCRPLR
jgi:hypothetical protein